jgi:DNA repair protein RadC
LQKGGVLMNKTTKSLTLVRLQMVREEVEYYGAKKVNNPLDVVEVVRKFIGNADREMFLAIHLATDSRINAVHVISIGSLNQSVVHPRECFKVALLCNAMAVVFAHNHPSGSLKPSAYDKQITTVLKQCGDLLNVKVLDHIIVSDKSYFSFSENSLL